MMSVSKKAQSEVRRLFFSCSSRSSTVGPIRYSNLPPVTSFIFTAVALPCVMLPPDHALKNSHIFPCTRRIGILLHVVPVFHPFFPRASSGEDLKIEKRTKFSCLFASSFPSRLPFSATFVLSRPQKFCTSFLNSPYSAATTLVCAPRTANFVFLLIGFGCRRSRFLSVLKSAPFRFLGEVTFFSGRFGGGRFAYARTLLFNLVLCFSAV